MHYVHWRTSGSGLKGGVESGLGRWARCRVRDGVRGRSKDGVGAGAGLVLEG